MRRCRDLVDDWPMRLANGGYECTLCGAILDVPEEMTALVEAAELVERYENAIVVEGVEIHRCSERGAVMLSLVLGAVPVNGALLSLAGCI